MASFSTVSLMLEDPDIVARFVDYYRRLGSEEIIIFFDGPVSHLAGLDLTRVALDECDAAFWAKTCGTRPEDLVGRQEAVYQVGLSRCKSDWMRAVDADEFVFGDGPVGAFLDRVPDTVEVVRLTTAEAVWGPGDDIEAPFGSTYFREPFRRYRRLICLVLCLPLYRGIAHYFRRGLIGHSSGKQFLRTGRQYSLIGCHHTVRDGQTVSHLVEDIRPRLPAMYVGHFDAISLARWLQKWQRRISKETLTLYMQGPRQSQMAAVDRAIRTGDAASRRLFRRFYGLTRVQYALLAAVGHVFRRPIFPERKP